MSYESCIDEEIIINWTMTSVKYIPSFISYSAQGSHECKVLSLVCQKKIDFLLLSLSKYISILSGLQTTVSPHTEVIKMQDRPHVPASE